MTVLLLRRRRPGQPPYRIPFKNQSGLRVNPLTQWRVNGSPDLHRSSIWRGHPPGRGRWHTPSSRHLRALISVLWEVFVCGFGVLFLSCVSVSVSGVLFSVGVYVCVCVCLWPVDLLHRSSPPQATAGAATRTASPCCTSALPIHTLHSPLRRRRPGQPPAPRPPVARARCRKRHQPRLLRRAIHHHRAVAPALGEAHREGILVGCVGGDALRRAGRSQADGGAQPYILNTQNEKKNTVFCSYLLASA